ncbi:hypothetical protein Tco_1555981 [Tanacetum coccineum]
MKKLKENVHAIQVGCQLYGGVHLDKECPLNKEVKSTEEVNYEESGKPFPNNNRNDNRFNKGVSGYDQPSSGERRPSLTEIINKYMEDAAKRHVEQDQWLKKFYQRKKTNREAHDKIIQGLETKRKLNNFMLNEYFSAFSGSFGINDKTRRTDDSGGLPNNEEKHYWESINDNKRENLEWEELSLNDWMKIRDEEDDIEENLEDPEECGEDKANVIMGAIHDKLNDDWFNDTIKITGYNLGPKEIYTKLEVLGIDEMPRTRDNVATIRAGLMEKMAKNGSGQEMT